MKGNKSFIFILLFFILFLILIYTQNTFAQNIGKDKILHFLFSFDLYLLSYYGISPLFFIEYNEYFNKFIFSGAISFIPGLLKELYDSFQVNNYFDIYDLIADILGILSAYFIINILEDKAKNESVTIKFTINYFLLVIKF